MGGGGGGGEEEEGSGREEERRGGGVAVTGCPRAETDAAAEGGGEGEERVPVTNSRKSNDCNIKSTRVCKHTTHAVC